jgi:RND family efflux transporter MFP subunit
MRYRGWKLPPPPQRIERISKWYYITLMTMPAKETSKATLHKRDRSHRRRRWVINIVLSIALIAAGIAGAAYINKTAPKARKRPPVKRLPLVQVIQVHPEEKRILVPAMGTVIPAREIVLESRVAGEIVSIHPEFTVGGYLEKGSEILQIDPQDYELALTLARARVKDAESKLKLLKAEAEAAKDEWRQINRNRAVKKNKPSPLLLKKPQLTAAQAQLVAEKADVKKAQLNLSRTKILAPFNAIVRAKHVDIGSQVSGQDRLAELVGTDEYWIQASMPVDRLDWILIPRISGEPGAKVRIFYRNGIELSGTVIKLLGELESEGRMARVLIEVQDPLGLNFTEKKHPPLLIGEYVRMEIEGRQLKGVYRIPRAALRDNTRIWLASNEGKLEIRTVETLWRDAQTVLLTDGLQPGEQLIVSDLAKPVNGMPLQVAP